MPLYVLATPIGTLGDLSPRAREVLSAATRIAAEDTRVTRKLLSALGIPSPQLISYRGHDEAQRAESVAALVERGESVVLVSDAGTPAISDPGTPLVRECHQRGLPVLSVPGPSALATALSVSGLPAIPSSFLGFSPKKSGPLRRWLLDAGASGHTFVFFEAPGRTPSTVALLAELFPDRELCMARELSKLHEEVLLLPAPQLAAALAERDELRGEVALVVGPGAPPESPSAALAAEAGLGDIASALAQRWGVPRREAYEALLELERRR